MNEGRLKEEEGSYALFAFLDEQKHNCSTFLNFGRSDKKRAGERRQEIFVFQTDTAITALHPPRPPGRREVPEALLMGLIRRGEVGEGDRQKGA